MATKDSLVNLKDITKECDRVRKLFPTLLLHNTLGKGIGFYSNDDHTYQAVIVKNTNGKEIMKTTFNSDDSVSISIDKEYLNKRSLDNIINRLKKIKKGQR